MKNIHILPTDKQIKNVGDLVKDQYGDIHIFTKNDGKEYGKTTTKLNIYITSDEEIKDVRPHKGKWQLEQGQILNKFPSYLTDLSECKLVIMTTDQDLIKDGVQAIDDEFLEWFVKNPSCEEVEVTTYINDEYEWGDDGTNDAQHYFFKRQRYKIIIPKEEQTKCYCGHTTYCDCGPKQETLEEVAERLFSKEKYPTEFKTLRKAFISNAKWQQEQDKSLCSNLIDLLERLTTIYKEDSDLHKKYDKKRLEFIEKFKNK